ncbi:hypothetical protein [Rhodococcus qingshengii]
MTDVVTFSVPFGILGRAASVIAMIYLRRLIKERGRYIATKHNTTRNTGARCGPLRRSSHEKHRQRSPGGSISLTVFRRFSISKFPIPANDRRT